MDLPANGFELLKLLQEKNTKRYRRLPNLKTYFELKAREKGIPLFGDFELTPLCNFNCKMCYVHLETDQLNGQDVLSVEKWKDLMHQAYDAGMISALLTGGECLAYLGFEDLFIYLHSLGCEVGVLTNGFLLDEKRIQFFRNHMPSVIQITLYGWNDDVYERVTGKRAFTTVMANIRRAIEAELPICISITPNQYLGEDLLETIRVAKNICKSVRINSFINIPREETGRSEQRDDVDIDLYIRAYKYCEQLEGRNPVEIGQDELPPCGGTSHKANACGLRCGGGRSMFSINWRGVLKPCIDMEMICGYPLKDGFSAAWAKVNYEANHWPSVPECESCVYNRICNNCAAKVAQLGEPGKLPKCLCEQTRKLVCSGVRHIPECE